MHNQYLREQKFKKELWEEKSPYTEEAKGEEKKLSASDTIAMAKEKKKEATRQKLIDAWQDEVNSVTDEVIEDVASNPEKYSDAELNKIERVVAYRKQRNSKLKWFFPISFFIFDFLGGTNYFIDFNPNSPSFAEYYVEQESYKQGLTDKAPTLTSVGSPIIAILLFFVIFYFVILFVELPLIAPTMFIYSQYMKKRKGENINKKTRFAIFIGILVVWIPFCFATFPLLLDMINGERVMVPSWKIEFFAVFIPGLIFAFLIKPKKSKK